MARGTKIKSVCIKVIYRDKTLQGLTGKEEEVIRMPHGWRSGDFFDWLQERYPKIFKNFGPGYLGFTLNNKKPHVLDLLKDGDCYEFATWTNEEIAQDEIVKRLEGWGAVLKLPKGEFTMPTWMECTWRRVACDKDECKICGRIKQDRLYHIMKGEDPDSLESVFEDVGRNFKQALNMVKRDVERMGIDIINIDDIQEPPEPHEFQFYKNVQKWHKNLSKLARDAEESGNYWLLTEAAADLLWYKNTLLVKVYRQLCNRWHIEQGDGYGEFDHQYTKYVLEGCLNILEKSLGELSLLNSPQKGGLMLALFQLADLEKRIVNI